MKLRLKELRDKLGISKKDIHKATGISLNTLINYERGSTPSIVQIELIAKAYNVNPAWLIGWIKDEHEAQPTEKIIEKTVYVEKDIGRVPSYYQPDASGNVIRWKEPRKTIPIRKNNKK